MKSAARFLTAAILAAAASFNAFADSDTTPSRTPVFEMNTDGSRFYRIPGLAVAADGSLIAVADKRGDRLGDLPNTISVVARRSTDNGLTWSDMVTIAQADKEKGLTYGDPAIVVDRATGTIMVLYTGDQGFWTSTPDRPARLYYSLSTDNGLTWTAPTEFTSQVAGPQWHGSFIASGRATQLDSGRIMAVANVHQSDVPGRDTYEYAIWTDDLGKTWSVSSNSATPDGNGNESKIYECADGSLTMSIRAHGNRLYSHSTDGGATWSEASPNLTLPDPDCNGDIIAYPEPVDGRRLTLHSLPGSSRVREHTTIYGSWDDGTTWPLHRLLYDGVAAYTSMAVLPDGSIGVLVEEGKWDSKLPGDDGFNIAFYRFPLNWLTEGAR